MGYKIYGLPHRLRIHSENWQKRSHQVTSCDVAANVWIFSEVSKLILYNPDTVKLQKFKVSGRHENRDDSKQLSTLLDLLNTDLTHLGDLWNWAYGTFLCSLITMHHSPCHPSLASYASLHPPLRHCLLLLLPRH